MLWCVSIIQSMIIWFLYVPKLPKPILQFAHISWNNIRTNTLSHTKPNRFMENKIKEYILKTNHDKRINYRNKNPQKKNISKSKRFTCNFHDNATTRTRCWDGVCVCRTLAAGSHTVAPVLPSPLFALRLPHIEHIYMIEARDRKQRKKNGRIVSDLCE